jgi:8-oxo-dGTP diphosphatase
MQSMRHTMTERRGGESSAYNLGIFTVSRPKSYHQLNKNARAMFLCYTEKMKEETETHFDGKIAQKAIIEHKGEVLILRDPREADEIWEIPGGRLNEGEDPRLGLQREVFEELGVECEVHEVIHLEQFFQRSEGKNALVIVYRATLKEPMPHFTLENKEVAEIRWIAKDELNTVQLFPEYKRALDTYFNTL